MTHPAVVTYLRWVATLPDLSGLDEDDAHREFLQAHDQRCGLCREPFDDRGNRVLDHDHRTGHVRGMLCGPCNQDAPSVVDHDPIRSWRSPQMARYCQYPPAAAMRLRLIYVDHVMGKDPAPFILDYTWFPAPTLALRSDARHPRLGTGGLTPGVPLGAEARLLHGADRQAPTLRRRGTYQAGCGPAGARRIRGRVPRR